MLRSPYQLRQLGDIGRDAPRFVASEQGWRLRLPLSNKLSFHLPVPAFRQKFRAEVR